MSAENVTENASKSTEFIEQNTTKQFDVLLSYHVAILEDCESLSLLVNEAYRGESSRRSWTSEDLFMGGQRVDVEMLTDIINDKTNVILMFFDSIEKILVGCVHLQHKSAIKAAHLSMVTVHRNLQERGYGKFILSAAENYAVNHWNVEEIEMSVITLRSKMIAYYNRRGYIDTGLRKPFPVEDLRFGIPKRPDLEFCVMKKCLAKT